VSHPYSQPSAPGGQPDYGRPNPAGPQPGYPPTSQSSAPGYPSQPGYGQPAHYPQQPQQQTGRRGQEPAQFAAPSAPRPTISSDEMAAANRTVQAIREGFATKVVGQHDLSRALLVTLISRGHILLESVPGLAKTLAASTLASTVQATFHRIQCTPDLLPSDIIGTQVFDSRTADFITQLGPVHANFVLLDEINRSSAKTQSAMLEAMQERQTTIGGETHRLPEPFMVLATQNPIEEEGTYVLPQAQMDRFLLKEIVNYPTMEEEFEVLNRIETGELDSRSIDAVVSPSDVENLQDMATRVYVDAAIKRYIVALINATRHPAQYMGEEVARYVEYGASPRGAIAMLTTARAMALINGRGHVIPEDVQALRHSILRHRLVLTFEALADRVRPEMVIDAIFQAVPTP